MSLYSKPQFDLIYDLIEQSNPGFKSIIPEQVLGFTGAIAVSPSPNPTINAQVRTKLKQVGAGITGVQSFNYRRISLNALFRNTRFALSFYSDGGALPGVETIRAHLNRVYGLSLEPGELTRGSQVSGNQYNYSIDSSALCYTPDTFTISWSNAARSYQDILPTGTLLDVFSLGADLPQWYFAVASTDHRPIKSVFDSFMPQDPSSAVITITQSTVGITDLAQWWGIEFDPTVSYEQSPTGFLGRRMQHLATNNAGVPNANSVDFVGVYYVFAEQNRPALYFHYN